MDEVIWESNLRKGKWQVLFTNCGWTQLTLHCHLSSSCLPPHGYCDLLCCAWDTHLSRSVVFAVLKHYLSVEWDALLHTTGNAIDKGKFLQVISKAYITTWPQNSSRLLSARLESGCSIPMLLLLIYLHQPRRHQSRATFQSLLPLSLYRFLPPCCGTFKSWKILQIPMLMLSPGVSGLGHHPHEMN